MKQLLITDRFLPHLGGSRIYYYEICNHLKIPLLTGNEQGDKEFDSQQTFPIYRRWGIRPDYMGRYHPSSPGLNLLINYIPPLLCMIFWSFWITLKLRPQIIHAGGFQFAGFTALLMKRCFGCSFIIYAHGEEIHATRNNRFLSIYMRWVYLQSDHIIANSEFTKALLISLAIPNEKISIVPPGVSKAFFQQSSANSELTTQFGLQQKKVLLSVGRLTPRKGHEQVLLALPEVIKKIPNLHYLIVGSGENLIPLVHLCEQLHLNQYVTFVGTVEKQQLYGLYQLCDVFILVNRMLPNDVEGFGMVFLEAGAAGKPVIGGRSGGAVEAIQDQITGILVDAENLTEITQSILDLVLDQARCIQLGRNGKAWASLFLWDQQINKINAIIQRHIQVLP
ncbi:MAG: hypothetical protein COB67_06635 [SAR324 cluster bacterium]|uniref:Glycosyltransferase family 4 protein n=1 Tax=SAR324 cluster bacterium TaxID=2024889 RepID=A0A2A4T4Q9_9DELT|nr:MAG: hypothetical protein COB67_06635 [SAR324 cluster bacterium]